MNPDPQRLRTSHDLALPAGQRCRCQAARAGSREFFMAPASYLAFLPQPTPGQHHVLAVADHGGGAELCAVASFAQAPSATMLADALNGVMSRQVTAGQRLDAALEGAPEPVRAAVARLVPALAASDDPQALRMARYLRVTGGGGFLLFPVTSCPPGGCETCGSCQQDCAGAGNAPTAAATSACR
jgi:hypothetical protein